MIAPPVFGHRIHIRIGRRLGFIRGMAGTCAPATEGHLLRQVVSPDNTNAEVLADCAYRSWGKE
jgi:hypothetical protein